MSDQQAPTKTISDFEATLDKADKNVASFDRDDRTFGHIIRSFLRTYPTMIPALVLVFSIIGFGFLGKHFLTPGTMSLVLQQVMLTGIIAIAQTCIILTAGIDLSVGEIMVFASIVMGKLAVDSGWPVPLAIAVGMVLACLMGALNGALVAYIRLPAFIVTLGTLGIFRALKLWYSQSETVRAIDVEQNAPFLLWFGKSWTAYGFELTYGGIALILLAVLVWYMLNRTAWGRHVHAMGDSPDSALLAGVNTKWTLVSVYTFAGLICGFAAWVMIGRVGSATPIGFETMNLDSITAVVIGGTSLFGGRGSIIGSVLGAMIVGVFSTGLSLAGVDDYWQLFATGWLVIIAVAIDQWLRRASQ